MNLLFTLCSYIVGYNKIICEHAEHKLNKLRHIKEILT